jgi:tRNA threonylcarbamoyladenosine biosynthesis protein TsaB
MLVLGLDTTTRQGSAALTRDGVVIAVQTGDSAIAHAARLPGDLLRLLEVERLTFGDIDLFAVASGPGSFTGLRIGIATMQGLALANGKPLAGVSALDAMHNAVACALGPQPSALSPQPSVAVWMDAGRGQVFSAVYTIGAAVEAAVVDKPADILARWNREGPRPAVFAGDGAVSYRELIRASRPDAHVMEPPPLAPSVAQLAEVQVRTVGPSAPDAIKPVYIRRSDVELARERAAAAKS